MQVLVPPLWVLTPQGGGSWNKTSGSRPCTYPRAVVWGEAEERRVGAH